MKPKAADDVLNTSSEDDSQSEDDEDGWMLTEEVEKEFYKTLSKIKNKDPKIYEKNVEFFKNVPSQKNHIVKSKKSTPLTIRDYEVKLAVEKGGILPDEDEQEHGNHLRTENQPTYVEEQESLKKGLKALVENNSDDSENDENWGGLFKKKNKTTEDKKREDEHYKEWLKGQKGSASDEEVEQNLKPLRDFWSDPKLNEDEQFLRDYVLNKRFLEQDDKDEVNKEVLLEEAEELKEEDEYEHKYNHRFEEPDQEFIKRYPRVMENSLRRKNDHRKQVRDKVKERKVKEKEKKKAEIRQKKKLKKMEVEEKLEELKKLTGNNQLAFDNVLENDFDMDAHDKLMQRLFNEEFYSGDDPNFYPSETTEYNSKEEHTEENKFQYAEEELNCEDPNFNMDCDYDPAQDKPLQKDSRSRRRKDKHRRTTVSQAISREKPSFDPSVHQSFQHYLDEYYSIDCEDFIGDLPCRFKYRQTVPNSYGLTIEEILAADEKELERWCSIKRIQQLRPEYKEKGDINMYKKKAKDEQLKRKILPSLFKMPEENAVQDKQESKGKDNLKCEDVTEGGKKNKKKLTTEVAELKNNSKEKQDTQIDFSSNKIKSTQNIDKNKTKNKKNKQKLNLEFTEKSGSQLSSLKRKRCDVSDGLNTKLKEKHVEKKFKKGIISDKGDKNNKATSQESSLSQMSDARLLAYGIKPKKFRNKLKYNKNKG